MGGEGGKEISPEKYCSLPLLLPVLYPGPERHNKTARGVRGWKAEAPLDVLPRVTLPQPTT